MSEAEDRLYWVRHGADAFRAVCGGQGQGRVEVRRTPFGGWGWRLDMLPLDAEPCLRSTRDHASHAAAMMAAERQVAAWPSVIEGAMREPAA